MARRNNRRHIQDDDEIVEIDNSAVETNTQDIPPESNESESTNDPDVERMANELVRMVLFEEQSRSVIRKANIQKRIISDTISGQNKTKIYRSIFTLAQSKLRSTFGMELVPLPAREFPQDEVILSRSSGGTGTRKRAIKKQKTVADENNNSKDGEEIGDTYILKTVIPEEYRQVISEMRSEKEREFYGYAFIVCSIILLHEKSYIEKSDLAATYLYPLGIDIPVVDTILTKLSKHHYIVQKTYKDTRGDKRLQYYSLGPRAKVEFSDNEGFKYICSSILGSKYTGSVSEQIDLRLQKVSMFTGQIVKEPPEQPLEPLENDDYGIEVDDN